MHSENRHSGDVLYRVGLLSGADTTGSKDARAASRIVTTDKRVGDLRARRHQQLLGRVRDQAERGRHRPRVLDVHAQFTTSRALQPEGCASLVTIIRGATRRNPRFTSVSMWLGDEPPPSAALICFRHEFRPWLLRNARRRNAQPISGPKTTTTIRLCRDWVRRCAGTN